MAKALGVLGSIDYFEKEYSEAQKAWDKALVLYRELEDKRGIARVLNNLGYSLHTQGNIERAQELYLECLAICRELEDKWNMFHVLENPDTSHMSRG
jgi:tetratricopeptide (TPR) repeat protein